MITPNPIMGTFFHAVGGASASTCYLPYQKTNRWSWGTFWLAQSVFAWLLMPLLIGVITVPYFFDILLQAPPKVIWGAFLLGAVYGFGGMSFGFAIRNIGYSLTYTIGIGLSAILGTVTPLLLKGEIIEYFSRPGSNIVLWGMVLSIIGVALCGLAGFRKERDLGEHKKEQNFNMTVGLMLAIIAGLLSAVFNISLEVGQPIADLAAKSGAGEFQGDAKLIVSTAGCFVVNLIWFLVLGIRQNTLKEFIHSELTTKQKAKNLLWSAIAGSLWCGQFFFYGLGHVRMGDFKFVSWVLHMSMLIFFSYIVGVVMKEWKNVSKRTYAMLLFALFILIIASVTISYGSFYGDLTANAK
ncbi:L-rhamnose/proton symporter RhaT [Microbacter margulisiae]|uniref:L-rhamnose-H+ transport protein n=1 Tax=Microbacter margulisiae TaxID=1350067 RepID=A0A7W5H1T0_9PORP|nr:L-rhamnose/proton symporter RhaT [Microbacter margulisiae]MBB3187010.1 L-rhamnose-H+ transport protein [Microbacter margulisiae]